MNWARGMKNRAELHGDKSNGRGPNDLHQNIYYTLHLFIYDRTWLLSFHVLLCAMSHYKADLPVNASVNLSATVKEITV